MLRSGCDLLRRRLLHPGIKILLALHFLVIDPLQRKDNCRELLHKARFVGFTLKPRKRGGTADGNDHHFRDQGLLHLRGRSRHPSLWSKGHTALNPRLRGEIRQGDHPQARDHDLQIDAQDQRSTIASTPTAQTRSLRRTRNLSGRAGQLTCLGAYTRHRRILSLLPCIAGGLEQPQGYIVKPPPPQVARAAAASAATSQAGPRFRSPPRRPPPAPPPPPARPVPKKLTIALDWRRTTRSLSQPRDHPAPCEVHSGIRSDQLDCIVMQPVNSDAENSRLHWNTQGRRQGSISLRSRSSTRSWAEVERRTHSEVWESTFSWTTNLRSSAKHRITAVLPFAVFPILDQADSPTRLKILESSSSPGIAVSFRRRAAYTLHSISKSSIVLHPNCPAVVSFDSLSLQAVKTVALRGTAYLQLQALDLQTFHEQLGDIP